jgi:hypothetical protein
MSIHLVSSFKECFEMNFARTKAFALPLLATLALVGTAAAYADPVLINGNFSGAVNGYTYEPSTVSGWYFSGGTGVQANGSAWGFSNAPGGSGQSAFLQSYNGSINVDKGNPNSFIAQNVGGLNAGQAYTVTFFLEQRPGYGANPVTVSIDGVTETITPPNDDTWTKYSVVFHYSVGPGTGTYDNDTGLADVSIAATPEPGTLMLLGTGLLGFAGFARRKFGARNA